MTVDWDIATVGGGDASIDEGLFLTRFARRLHALHRRDELRAGHILQERAFANDKMDFTWDTVVTAIEGSEGVAWVRLENVKSSEKSTLEVSGIFTFVGHRPNSGLIRGPVPLDAGGHAIGDLQMRTEVPGLFVAGDARALAVRQLVSAHGDGATAATERPRPWLRIAFSLGGDEGTTSDVAPPVRPAPAPAGHSVPRPNLHAGR